MKIRVPSSLVNSADSPFIVEAVYFVVRALRNALRGYPKAEVSTEPSPQARRLAEKAIKEIEAAEKKSVLYIEDHRINEYISKLQAFLTNRTAQDSNALLTDARRILRTMRSHGT